MFSFGPCWDISDKDFSEMGSSICYQVTTKLSSTWSDEISSLRTVAAGGRGGRVGSAEGPHGLDDDPARNSCDQIR